MKAYLRGDYIMKIKITKNLSFEEFNEKLQSVDRKEFISKLEQRIIKYENKYNMLSENFYKKYNNGDIVDSYDFYIWADKIEIYSNLLGILPENVRVGDNV